MIDFRGRRAILPWQLCAAAAFGLLLAPGVVHADEDDTLNFRVGASVMYEDNLFRLPANLDPLTVAFLLGNRGMSDQITVTYAAIEFDRTWSQQQVHLDATANKYQYRTFDGLDFDGVDYVAYWKWRLTQRLTGNLRADHKVAPAGFDSSTNYRGSNHVTTENIRFDADWWAHGSWHLTGGVAHSQYRNSQIRRTEDSSQQNSAEAGVRYVAESGSSLALLQRDSRGEYTDRQTDAAALLLLPTGFRETDTELRLDWRLSEKSSLNGRLTRLERRHEEFAQRDYQGTAGRLDYSLTPTGKLQLKLSAVRNIASYQDATTSYYVDDAFSFAPVWQISARTDLRLSLQRSRRDYLGGGVVALPVGRQDQMRTALIGFDWSPTRALSLTLSAQRDRRESNYANLGFEANIASITAQLAF